MIRFPRLLTLALLISLVSFDYKDPAIDYINTFSDIAIEEMQRTGIPASIKLAQALLESESGKSPLAINANNHFGIKCGKNWEGNTYYKTDDDTDSTGTIIESCFRSFATAEESFKAHSEFLNDPRKYNRYGFLFELEKSDYISWANGLKNAGYATDANYPTKLIRLIEKYNLTQFDASGMKMVNPEVKFVKDDGDIKPPANSRLKKGSENPRINLRDVMLKTHYANGVRSVLLPMDLSCEQLAKVLREDVTNILLFNEFIPSSTTMLAKGSIVSLEEKHRDYNGKEKYHIVKSGESVESISNLYGIKARTIYVLNKIPTNSDPLEGEKIYLKEKVSNKNKPRFKRKPAAKTEYLF